LCLQKDGPGCPIVDAAPDLELHQKINAFIQIESLSFTPGYARLQEQALVDSGLMEESVDTILSMKAVLREHQKWQAEIEKGKKAAEEASRQRRGRR
jgi:hypothetical protein